MCLCFVFHETVSFSHRAFVQGIEVLDAVLITEIIDEKQTEGRRCGFQSEF